MSSFRFRKIATSSCAAFILSAALANAQNAAPRTFEITPQNLSSALTEFARQSGTEILFAPEIVLDKTSPGVSGKLDPLSALTKLLGDNGLTFTRTPQGAILLKPAEVAGVKRQTIALAEQIGSSTSEFLAHSAAPHDNRTDATTRIQLEEILVTGSRIEQKTTDGAQPVKVYKREDILQSGQTTIGSFLNTLPQVSTVSQQGNQLAYGGQQGVQLRGLPEGTTLVLVNGRRIAPTSQSNSFVNLNLIPTSAVERVEVIPVGSSAIYGSNALAGVVNLVLKKEMRGAELDTRLSHADGLTERSASFVWGGALGKGEILALGSYAKRDELLGMEREITSDRDFRRFGHVDRRATNCNPGNVYSADGANLPGLDAPSAAIPSNPTGLPLQPQQLLSGEDALNRCSDMSRGSLITPNEEMGLHFAGSHPVWGGSEAFFELTMSRNDTASSDGRNAVRNVLIPAANPFNPFNADVRVDYEYPDEYATKGDTRFDFVRPLVGLRGNMNHSWSYEVVAWMTRDWWESRLVNNSINAAAQAAALSSSDPATSLNFFTSGRPASSDVMRSMFFESWRKATARRHTVSAFVQGPIFQTDAGEVRLAVGAEASGENHERLDIRFVQPGHASGARTESDVSRSERAAFAEARVPLIGAKEGASGELLAVSLAARYDDDSAYGSDTTWQGGLELRPLPSLLLRAGYSTAFKAPSLSQTQPGMTVAPLTHLTDPLRGGELPPDTSQYVFGPRPLEAETGRSSNLGVVWRSANVYGLQFGINRWRIQIDNRIGIVELQTLIDHESLFPGAIVRGPAEGSLPGPIEHINWGYYNFGKYTVDGFDVDAAGSLPTRFGRFSVSAAFTRTLSYETALTPGVPAQDRLSTADREGWAPKWKGNIQFGWSRAQYGAALTGRYLGEYHDYAPSSRRLGDFWHVDVSAWAEFTAPSWASMLGQGRVRLSSTNLFDRAPDFSEYFFGYDPTQADLRGRTWVADVSFRW